MRFVSETTVSVSPAPERKFAGAVWQAEVLDALRPGGLRAFRFVYAPGARSHWHVHEGEQAIVVVAGRGVVGRWGEAGGTEIGPGDWVHVDRARKHFHGAVPTSVLVHLAVTATGATDWQEPVTDDRYRSCLPPAQRE